MRIIRRVFRYLGISILLLISFAVLFVLCKTIQYKTTVGKASCRCQLIADSTESLLKWVDPFIGTGGFPAYTSGDDIPGATMPFGMVRLSPDTKYFLGSFLGDGNTVSTAGYYYGDNRLIGFSHTRLIGTGASDGGNFRVLPTSGNKGLRDYISGRYPKFSHDKESACPGYYSLRISESGIMAELTASEHTGVHRYTFTTGDTPHILIDVSSVMGHGRASDGEISFFPYNQEITGTITTYGSFSSRYGGIKVFFSCRFDKSFASYSIWNGSMIVSNADHARGDHLVADICFGDSLAPGPLVLKLGISYVSIENARLNRETETDNRSFSQIVAEAQEEWEDILSLVRIEGGSDDQKRIFYTSLYHSMQMPTIFSDVNGDYIGFDKKLHRADGFKYFTDMSLWDTFRNIHPLFTLLIPVYQLDMLISLVTMCKQGGFLPRWPSGYGYTGSMLGASADIVISDSYLKGIRGFDAEAAYMAMRKAALGTDIPKKGFKPREDMALCLQYGYCPADLTHKAVSKTLEYAYADYAISRLAKALGHYEDTALFACHSAFYRNIWNPVLQCFQPRNSSGEFVKNFKPRLLTYFDYNNEHTDDYVEGSALQWRWALFFNPDGLISLFRSRNYFVSELNSFFEHSDPTLGSWYPGSYYWHGNEPDIHAAYLFNSAGRPDLTQKWVRWILDNKYGSCYDGIDGDDDAGTLSAWYVFSALGLYPVAGSDIYQLGAPIFKKAELRLGGCIFTIMADNYAPENRYVKEVLLDDVPLDRWWIRHSEITGGGTLRFLMSNKPSKFPR
jgi:predicted alpha-1,2-mannosidase